MASNLRWIVLMAAAFVAVPAARADFSQLSVAPTSLAIGDSFTMSVVENGNQRGATFGPTDPSFLHPHVAEQLSCTGTECTNRLARGAVDSVVTPVVTPLLTTQTCYDGPLAFQVRVNDFPNAAVLTQGTFVTNRCRTLGGHIYDNEGNPIEGVYLWIEPQVPANYLVENPAFIYPRFIPNGHSAWYASSPLQWGYVARTDAQGAWSAVVPNIADETNLLASLGPDQCAPYVRNGGFLPPGCGQFLGYAVAPFSSLLTGHSLPGYGPLTYCDDPTNQNCGPGHSESIDAKIIAQRGDVDFGPRFHESIFVQFGDMTDLNFTALLPGSLRVSDLLVQPAEPHPGDLVVLNGYVTNDGGQDIESVIPTLDFGGSDAVTDVSVQSIVGDLAVGETRLFVFGFEATHEGSVTARVKATGQASGTGKTVVSETVGKSFDITGASMSVTLTATPSAPSPGDDIVITATILNTSDVDLSDVVALLPLSVRPGSDVTVDPPMPSTLAVLAAHGPPATMQWRVRGALGRVRMTAEIGAHDKVNNPVRAQGHLDLQVGMPRITWEIEPRFRGPADIADTPAAANPTEYWFRVTLERSDGSACDTRFVPSWELNGVVEYPVAVPGEPCIYRFSRHSLAPFEVVATLFRDGEAADEARTTIIARDILIASLGDSLSSGEGVPDGPGGWTLRQCDRSLLAGPAAAAMRLERDDPHTSITFVHQACSGAKADTGLLYAYEGIHPVEGQLRNSQIMELRRIAGERKIDDLVLSIGINDVEFGGVAAVCAESLAPACYDAAYHDELLPDWLSDAVAQLPGHYTQVANLLGQIGVAPSDVFLLEYPDPSRDDGGNYCPLGTGGDGLIERYGLIDAAEWQWAYESLLAPLNQQGDFAANQLGWNRVGGFAGAFATHGMCAVDTWVVGLLDSFYLEGDRNGAFHPNYLGHDVYADAIYSALQSRVVSQMEGSSDVVPTLLAAAAHPGDSEVDVTEEHFHLGDTVTINPGASNQETRFIVGKGSLIFFTPLQREHEPNEPILLTETLPPEVTGNHAPYAYDDWVTLDCEQDTFIDVLANDVDIDENEFLNVDENSIGSPFAYYNWPGTPRPGISYEVMGPDFAGDEFTYSVVDLHGASRSATVHVLPCGVETTTTTETIPTTTSTSTTVTTVSTTTDTSSTSTTTTTTLPPSRAQLLSGASLVLKAKPPVLDKDLLTAKLTSTALGLGLGAGGPDDPRVVGAVLHLVGVAGGIDQTYALPANNWSAAVHKGAIVGWIYKDAKHVAGPITGVKLEAGKALQAKGKGAGLGFVLATDPTAVRMTLAIGDGQLRYCGRFGGTTSFKPGTQFKATKAPAPPACE